MPTIALPGATIATAAAGVGVDASAVGPDITLHLAVTNMSGPTMPSATWVLEDSPDGSSWTPITEANAQGPTPIQTGGFAHRKFAGPGSQLRINITQLDASSLTYTASLDY